MTDAASAPAPSERRPARRRHATDAFRLAIASFLLIALVLVERFFGGTVVGFSADLLRGLDALSPRLLAGLAWVSILVAAAAVFAGLWHTIRHRAWDTLLVVLAAGAVGGVLFAILQGWIDEQRAPLTELDRYVDVAAAHPELTAAGVAVAAAMTSAAGPWISRRWTRACWGVVWTLTIAVFVAAPLSAAPLAAVLCGWLAGALVLVVAGSPVSRPTTEEVVAALRANGVALARLEPLAVDARGSAPHIGTTEDGSGVFVKVLSRDERSADLLFRTYRAVLPRDLGDRSPFATLRHAVEHEAMAALLAAQLGVRTPAVVALCDAPHDGVVLAYRAVRGRSLDGVDDTALTDEVLRAVWDQVAILRRNRVAHRDLRLANLFLDDEGRIWIIDFGFAEVGASDVHLATDLAELLAATSLRVGVDRAVSAAGSAVDAEGLRTAVPRLQPALLSGATRESLAARPETLDRLRDGLTGSARQGVDGSPPSGEAPPDGPVDNRPHDDDDTRGRTDSSLEAARGRRRGGSAAVGGDGPHAG